jgi:DNA-binding transcriptional LysR family regulator
MQMHQIRYFLALCEESNFTRAAKRSGVSQPSLTTAIGALERELGGALFQRKPFVAMTVLGCEIEPYMRQIAATADLALRTAQAFAQMSDASLSANGEPPALGSQSRTVISAPDFVDSRYSAVSLAMRLSSR